MRAVEQRKRWNEIRIKIGRRGIRIVIAAAVLKGEYFHPSITNFPPRPSPVQSASGTAPTTKPQEPATLHAMSTLAEIETAADSLPNEEKEELFRFLPMRLRKDRAMPKP